MKKLNEYVNEDDIDWGRTTQEIFSNWAYDAYCCERPQPNMIMRIEGGMRGKKYINENPTSYSDRNCSIEILGGKPAFTVNDTRLYVDTGVYEMFSNKTYLLVTYDKGNGGFDFMYVYPLENFKISSITDEKEICLVPKNSVALPDTSMTFNYYKKCIRDLKTAKEEFNDALTVSHYFPITKIKVYKK